MYWFRRAYRTNEVLNAQRTFNEIQTKYYETLYNRATALIELEKAAGIWDIDF